MNIKSIELINFCFENEITFEHIESSSSDFDLAADICEILNFSLAELSSSILEINNMKKILF